MLQQKKEIIKNNIIMPIILVSVEKFKDLEGKGRISQIFSLETIMMIRVIGNSPAVTILHEKDLILYHECCPASVKDEKSMYLILGTPPTPPLGKTLTGVVSGAWSAIISAFMFFFFCDRQLFWLGFHFSFQGILIDTFDNLRAYHPFLSEHAPVFLSSIILLSSITCHIMFLKISPGDIKILGQCPAGPVLPHGEKVLLRPWLATILVIVSQQKCLMIYIFYIDQLCTSSFPIGLVKTESGFIVRTLVVSVISVDAYPFFDFLRPDRSP